MRDGSRMFMTVSVDTHHTSKILDNPAQFNTELDAFNTHSICCKIETHILLYYVQCKKNCKDYVEKYVNETNRYNIIDQIIKHADKR